MIIFFISVTLYHKKHILMVGDTMTKVDNFKEFVKKNQVLVTYVKENKMTWQKFYELYDLYGEDNNIWNEYLKKEEPQTKVNNTKPSSLSNIMEMAKNIDALTKELGVIKEELDKKQDKLIAGKNIIIEDNVISATGGEGGAGVIQVENLPDNGQEDVIYCVQNDGSVYMWKDGAWVCYGRDYNQITLLLGGTSIK